MAGFALNHLSILRDLKRAGSGVAWPPPAATLMVAPGGSFSLPVVGTPEMVADRNRLPHEESERVIAHYKERDRQRAEHEERQAGSDLRRQVAERNRNAGCG
jgi:hypothetical protein